MAALQEKARAISSAVGSLTTFDVVVERPEDPARTVLHGTVFDMAYFGNHSLYRVRTDAGKILEVSAQNRRREARRYLEWDDEVYVSWDPASALLLTE